MNCRVNTLICMLAMSYFGSVAANQPPDQTAEKTESAEVDAILKEITSKRLAHSTLTYSSERIVRWGGEKNPASSVEQCNHEKRISDGKVQSFLECEERRFKGNVRDGGATKSYAIDDGKDRYYWHEDGDVVGKKTSGSFDEEARLIGFLHENYKLSVVQKYDALNQDSILALEGASNKLDDPTPTIRLEFDQHGLLTRYSKYDKEGAITYDFIVRNIRYDVPVDPDRMKFVKPSGMRIKEWETGKGLGVTQTGKRKSN